MLKKIKFWELFLSILLPLFVGAATSLIVTKFGSFMPYEYYPKINPPSVVFIIVWSVLYVLMGVSSYLINHHSSGEDEEVSASIHQANATYCYSLAVNFLYSMVFFIFKWPLLAFFICLYLAILVVQTICQYYHINNAAALLQLPYLLWSGFAGVLTFMIWWLNW